FSVNQETNFRDLDIAAVGPVVRETSRVFDRYWASDSAVPVAALIDEVYDNAWLANKAEELRKDIATGNYPYALDKDVDELWSKIDTLQHSFIWAPGTIVWDDPDVIDGDPEVGTPVIERLRRKLDTVDQSLFIESAYFVVGDGGVEQIRDMTARGVHVRVLTNSLVSNDVLAAHAGHASYRRDLIEAGAEMYELRADSEVIKKTWVGESRAGLHTKALVFDEESLFVGSFNLDPRSANINTEAGLYVESPELAARLLDYMDEGVELRFDADPLSTFWERLQSGVIGLLPIESQL
ncbi:MAG: phospholipase D-like domain-containing protein, partial [Halioglobus sp.]